MENKIEKIFDEVLKEKKLKQITNRKFLFDVLNFGKIKYKDIEIDYSRSKSSFIDVEPDKLFEFLIELRRVLRGQYLYKNKYIRIITSSKVIHRFIANSNIFKQESEYFDMFPKDYGFAQNFIFEDICITIFDVTYTNPETEIT